MARGKGEKLTVVIGPSDSVFEVRRTIGVRSSSDFHSSSDLPALRRRLLQGRRGRIIVCVVLDRSTVDDCDYGRGLRQFLADLPGLPGASHSIGLLVDNEFDPIVAGLGCDVYAGGTAQAGHMIRSLLAADGSRRSRARSFVATPCVLRSVVRWSGPRRSRRRTVDTPGWGGRGGQVRTNHGGPAGRRVPPGNLPGWLFPPPSFGRHDEGGCDPRDWPKGH